MISMLLQDIIEDVGSSDKGTVMLLRLSNHDVLIEPDENTTLPATKTPWDEATQDFRQFMFN